MSAWYNEHDPYAAAWLRNLIEAGHIAPGVVDERSIEDVVPDELSGFAQCHFFAGVGVWSANLRAAGWPDDRPVWTGSCPCQPFSAAGKGDGFADERHLWPAWFHLIGQCRPEIVLGEQVASRDGLAWLDLVSADMEGAGYAGGAVDLCAAGVGAPHIRQRLFFGWADGMENAELSSGSRQRRHGRESLCKQDAMRSPGGSLANGLVNTVTDAGVLRKNLIGGLEYAARDRRIERRPEPSRGSTPGRCGNGRLADAGRPGPVNGLWRNADWLHCRDGKWRPVEPGTFPLAHGIANRVGRLRAYGNAINLEAAKVFIEAFGGALAEVAA